MSAVDAVTDRIAAARLLRAQAMAGYLKTEFLTVMENSTQEERQATALKAKQNAQKPPSQETWNLVMAILRGA